MRSSIIHHLLAHYILHNFTVFAILFRQPSAGSVNSDNDLSDFVATDSFSFCVTRVSEFVTSVIYQVLSYGGLV